MVTIILLTDEEKEWASKHNYDVDNLTSEIAREIKQKMKEEKEANQPEQAHEMSLSQPETQNKEQKEEKQTLNIEEDKTTVPQTNEETRERYENSEAEAIFRKYAAEKGYDFTINENDTEALSGEFSKDGIGKGRVRVKDDSATSDIEGIESLVYYANEKGMSITLGNCTPEYKAEMEKFCIKMGVDLLYSQPALESTQVEQPIPLGEGRSESEQNLVPDTAPIDKVIDVEENKGMEMPTYQINPKIVQMDLKKYLRDASQSPTRFESELANKTKNFEKGWYDKLGPAAKEKACADILMQQYAAAFVKGESDEKLQNTEMALKMYGLESITIDPKESEGKVTITTKNFKEREAEEMGQIKICHDALVPFQKDKANTSDNDRYFNSKGSDRDR